MTAIRVIFDGKAFIPQQPVSLPNQSEALVLVDQTDLAAQSNLDTAIRGGKFGLSISPMTPNPGRR